MKKMTVAEIYKSTNGKISIDNVRDDDHVEGHKPFGPFVVVRGGDRLEVTWQISEGWLAQYRLNALINATRAKGGES